MRNMKRNLSVLLAMVMVLAMMVVPAFGTTNAGALAMLTLPGTDFTVVGVRGQQVTLTVSGLDANYAPVAIPDPSQVRWSVAEGNATIVSTSGATAVFELVGDATVRADYGDGIPGSYDKGGVTSNFVVEPTIPGGAKAVNVRIWNPEGGSFVTLNNVSVNVFDTSAYITDGDDADVLKKNPSVLHATIKALEKEYGAQAVNNITISSQGTYISSMCGIDSYYNPETYESYGWSYKVDTASPAKSASICSLNDYAGIPTITWTYGLIQY